MTHLADLIPPVSVSVDRQGQKFWPLGSDALPDRKAVSALFRRDRKHRSIGTARDHWMDLSLFRHCIGLREGPAAHPQLEIGQVELVEAVMMRDRLQPCLHLLQDLRMVRELE